MLSERSNILEENIDSTFPVKSSTRRTNNNIAPLLQQQPILSSARDQSQVSQCANENVANTTESEINSQQQQQQDKRVNRLQVNDPLVNELHQQQVQVSQRSTNNQAINENRKLSNPPKRLIDFDFLQDDYPDDENEINLGGYQYLTNQYVNYNYEDGLADDSRENVLGGEQEENSNHFMTSAKIASFYRQIKERLLTQEDKYSAWKKAIKKEVGMKFSEQFIDNPGDSKSFAVSMNSIHAFANASERFKYQLVDHSNWSALHSKTDFTSDGLSLADRVAKIAVALNQRTLVTVTNMQFRLRGNSQLNVLLRCSSAECTNEEASLLRFVKEGYAFEMRLFVLIGRYDAEVSEFVFLKKCEVPLVKVNDEQAIGDYLDVACKIVDLGTDEIQLKASVNDFVSDAFKITFKQSALPIFEDFSLYLAGTGEDLAVSRIMIEQADRKEYLKGKNRNCHSSPLCHCNILQANFIG